MSAGAEFSALCRSTSLDKAPIAPKETNYESDRIQHHFIFLRAGYSTHKRFVLGGEECAAPFSGNTFVAY
jgi:hypothetical protein